MITDLHRKQEAYLRGGENLAIKRVKPVHMCSLGP